MVISLSPCRVCVVLLVQPGDWCGCLTVTMPRVSCVVGPTGRLVWLSHCHHAACELCCWFIRATGVVVSLSPCRVCVVLLVQPGDWCGCLTVTMPRVCCVVDPTGRLVWLSHCLSPCRVCVVLLVQPGDWCGCLTVTMPRVCCVVDPTGRLVWLSHCHHVACVLCCWSNRATGVVVSLSPCRVCVVLLVQPGDWCGCLTVTMPRVCCVVDPTGRVVWLSHCHHAACELCCWSNRATGVVVSLSPCRVCVVLLIQPGEWCGYLTVTMPRVCCVVGPTGRLVWLSHCHHAACVLCC